MPWSIPDHPDIRDIERTGYPSWNQPDETIYCERCGKEISDEDQFQMNHWKSLCVDCLLELCLKG